MKLFENQKSDNVRAIKLMGLTIYQKTIEQIANDESLTMKNTQCIACGLIKIFKLKQNLGYYIEKKVKIFGITVLKTIEDGDLKIKYICGKRYKQKSQIEDFKINCLKYIDNKYDDIYILNANSGEIYLFLTYLLDGFLKKNKSKNPLLVATKKYHIDVIKMICPEMPFIYIDKSLIRLKEDQYDINNFRFFIIFCDIYFRRVEYELKNDQIGKSHYFNSILNHADIPKSDINFRKAIVPLESEESMLKKISATGLNLNNFVLFAPEAQSCELLDNDFCINLINEFQKADIDVFVNIVGNGYDLSGSEFKTCFLTYSEVFALAQKAKKIISLRSGLTEFLLQTDVPIDVLYTKFRLRPIFKDMPVENVMSGFSIEKIMDVNLNKVREFNVEKYDNTSLLNEIIDCKGNRLCQR